MRTALASLLPVGFTESGTETTGIDILALAMVKGDTWPCCCAGDEPAPIPNPDDNNAEGEYNDKAEAEAEDVEDTEDASGVYAEEFVLPCMWGDEACRVGAVHGE
jgi:hypothetical protein